jgi:dTDP-4-dehydrorhamnose 3,5-epimerase
VTDDDSPAAERNIVWNDRDIAIDWPVGEACVLVSEKDQKGATLCDAEVCA